MEPEVDPNWFADEFDYSEECEDHIPSLKDLCSRKLASDVCLLQEVSKFPQPIISVLLMEALQQKRPLAVLQLLKYYQHKEFVLPSPQCLKSWSKIFCMDTTVKNTEIKNLRDRGWIVFNAICKLLSQENKTSKLCMIDLGDYLMESELGKVACDMIIQSGRKPEAMMQRYMKMGFTMLRNHDVLALAKLKRECTFSGIKVSVTGLNFYNNLFMDNIILHLLEQLDTSDLRLFSLNFAEVSPSLETTFVSIQKFTNLKILNLGYMRLDFCADSNTLYALSLTLYELVHLSHLSVNNILLTGCMKTLLQKYCIHPDESVKKQKTDSSLKCCILHRGTLQYLDFSACKLSHEDLMCLQKYPLTKTLKYLNISYNKFDIPSLSQYLEAMSESLVVLLIEHCLPEDSLSHTPFLKLSKMTKLQCISLLGLEGQMIELESLAQDLKEMESLKRVYLSVSCDWYFPQRSTDSMKKIENIISEHHNVKTSWKYYSFFTTPLME